MHLSNLYVQKLEEEERRLSQLEGSELGDHLKREKAWEKTLMKVLLSKK